MVGEMETKEKPKPTPDYLMQLMNDKKLMSSLPNFCGIFNHLERLLDEGESPPGPSRPAPGRRPLFPGPDALPPACGEGGKVVARGDRAPGDREARAGRTEAAPRPGSRGAAGGRGSAARAGPTGGTPPRPRAPRRPRAALRRLHGEPPAPPASSRAWEHRDGPELRGPPGEEPGPAPRGRLKDTGLGAARGGGLLTRRFQWGFC